MKPLKLPIKPQIRWNSQATLSKPPPNTQGKTSKNYEVQENPKKTAKRQSSVLTAKQNTPEKPTKQNQRSPTQFFRKPPNLGHHTNNHLISKQKTVIIVCTKYLSLSQWTPQKLRRTQLS